MVVEVTAVAGIEGEAVARGGKVMERDVIRVLDRMTLALLGLVALAMVLWMPGFGLAASGDVSAEQNVRWYDPSDWFNKGGNLPHESQWYRYTYGLVPANSTQGAYGYYPPMEAEMPPGSPQMEHYDGEILGVRNAWFRNGPLQVFARIRLDSGVTTAAALGPRSQLNFIDLGALRGKRIAILTHEATIAGEKALVAHKIRLYGRKRPWLPISRICSTP
jgi:hypothetical protein